MILLFNYVSPCQENRLVTVCFFFKLFFTVFSSHFSNMTSLFCLLTLFALALDAFGESHSAFSTPLILLEVEDVPPS